MSATEEATVLVVDDDSGVVTTYRRYLEDTYAVREAYDGEAALSTLDADGDDVDVILLDRLLPGLSGREVLARIRARAIDVRVAMVTAVDPDFDVVDMGFDDYVTKPTTREELRTTVDQLVELTRRAADVQEYHSLLATLAALREGRSTDELDGHETYADLKTRVAALESTFESEADRLTDDAQFVATLRAIEGEPTEDRDDG